MVGAVHSPALVCLGGKEGGELRMASSIPARPIKHGRVCHMAPTRGCAVYHGAVCTAPLRLFRSDNGEDLEDVLEYIRYRSSSGHGPPVGWGYSVQSENYGLFGCKQV